jgi:hypothetical protein
MLEFRLMRNTFAFGVTIKFMRAAAYLLILIRFLYMILKHEKLKLSLALSTVGQELSLAVGFRQTLVPIFHLTVGS